MSKFDDDGIRPVQDDQYWDLFADCKTPEEVVALEAEIVEAEES